jgi:hypothetical protein
VIDLPAGAPGGKDDQKFTLKYLWNKGGNHAYDSLVKWNTTISGLDAAGVCNGVTGTCPAAGANFNNGDGQNQAGIPVSSCTGTHDGFGIASRDMVAFNTTDLSVDTPVNDSSSCSLSADEYETLTVHFKVASLPARVMFLFAGHLACGTNRTGCWGSGSADTNGSSAINGGPYHIKLLTIDGTTAGNQDNQIMSSAIAPLTIAGVSTTPGASATSSVSWTETLTDSASVSGSSPTGTVTFKLYSGGTCTSGAPDGTLIYTSPAETVSAGSAATGTTDGYTVGTGHTNGAGTYQWIAEYSGDSNNSPATSTCGGEVQTVTAATTSGPSVS